MEPTAPQGPSAHPLEDLGARIERAARAAGFVSAGVATRAALAGVPTSADPARLLAGYRAVVVFAATPDGVVDPGPHGPLWLQPALAQAFVDARRLLEGAGYAALPLSERVASLPRLAAAAGLGEIGPVGMLVAWGHGLRLSLFALVTDAPFPAATPPGSSAAHRACVACGLCVEDCPAMLPGVFDLQWCTACGVCVAVCPA